MNEQLTDSDIRWSADGAAAAEPSATPVTTTLVHSAIIIGLSLSVFLFQLGRTGWQDDMESVGAQVVQEMVSGNGWILPLRNDRHIPVKPSFFYWLGAVTAKIRGSDGSAFIDARLPSALFAVLGVIILYIFTRRIAGASTALWAALILITTPQFIIEARNPRVDMTFCVFLMAALFLVHMVIEGNSGRRAAIAAGLCVGLAILTKGPLALALAVLVVGASLLVARPSGRWRILLSPAALLLVACIPAVWYLAATLVHGLPFLRLQLYRENVSRITGDQGWFPMTWYIGPLVASGLPWTLMLPSVARRESTLPLRTRRFLWAWAIVMFVFFSIVPGKRRAYLLVLRPALAILVAGWLTPLLQRASEDRELRGRVDAPVPRAVHIVTAAIVVLGTLGIFALSMGVGGFGSSETHWSYWWRQYLKDSTLLALSVVLVLAVGIELIARWGLQRRFELAAYAFTGMLAIELAIGIASGGVVRGEGAAFQALAQQVAAHATPSTPLAFFDSDPDDPTRTKDIDDNATGLLVLLHRHIPVVTPANLERRCDPGESSLYLVLEKSWSKHSCFREAPWQVIARGGPAMQPGRRLVLAKYESVTLR